MSMDPDPSRPASPGEPYGRPSYEAPTQPPEAPPPTGSAVSPPMASVNGFAIAALVLGILGMMWFPPFIPSILALIFGYKGKREIDRSEGRQSGRGLAIAGIVLGWIGVVLMVLALAALIVSFAFAAGSNILDSLPLG